MQLIVLIVIVGVAGCLALRAWLGAFGTGLVAVFLAFVIWQGIVFVRATGIQMSPVLQIPFRHLYVIIPASAAVMLLYLVLGALDDLRDRRR